MKGGSSSGIIAMYSKIIIETARGFLCLWLLGFLQKIALYFGGSLQDNLSEEQPCPKKPHENV
jgi:hypothetical protein